MLGVIAEGTSDFNGDTVAPFFGFMGAASALICSVMGAAYGTAKSGVGVAAMGVMRPELVMKSIVPVVMAGVLGIYGLIIAVIISTGSKLLPGRPSVQLPVVGSLGLLHGVCKG